MHTKDVQLRDHSSRPAVCIPETSVDTYIAFIHVAPRAHLFLRSQMWLRKKERKKERKKTLLLCSQKAHYNAHKGTVYLFSPFNDTR